MNGRSVHSRPTIAASEIDSEDAMNWKMKRLSAHDGEWISARQAFVGTCWAALLAAFVIDQVLEPLFR